jgi:hypothetical protein
VTEPPASICTPTIARISVVLPHPLGQESGDRAARHVDRQVVRYARAVADHRQVLDGHRGFGRRPRDAISWTARSRGHGRALPRHGDVSAATEPMPSIMR